MYIRSAACLSPFLPLEEDGNDLVTALKRSGQRADGSGQNKSVAESDDPKISDARSPRFSILEPDYTKYVDPKMIRRMNRIVKMGVSTALRCLRRAGDPVPGAIITGTAYGCLEDTGIFLRKMVTNQEELLSPTAFIQSTHNTVGAQIALLLKCHSYNNCIVHRALSLEHALTESGMLLKEDLGPVLVGAIDELTGDSFELLRRFGLYDRPAAHRQHPIMEGYGAGEGAAFFLLQQAPSGKDLARIDHVATRLDPGAADSATLSWIYAELNRINIEPSRISTVLDGTGIFSHDAESPLSHALRISYKSICGEFPTASGFALWLGARLCQNAESIPASGTVLIVNRSPDGHNSLIIVSPC